MPDPMPSPPRLGAADLAIVEHVWATRWGTPVITPRGSFLPFDVEGFALSDEGGEVLGLVTWVRDGGQAEILSLDAMRPCQGFGSMLLAAAEGHLFGSGIRRLLLASSNDNLEAHAFYQRRGWRLTSVHLDAMDRVRSQKPGIPVLGLHGLPLRDVWDFEKLPRD